MASFDDLLKAMSPVNSGDSVFEVASAARMNAIMEVIRMLILGENVMEGPNIRKDSSGGKLILSADPSGRDLGGISAFPFKLSVIPRPDSPLQKAVKIYDGKVNNEWPDVGVTAMGGATGPGYQILNIGNVENCNVFLRAMFNAKTNAVVRLDIYERPNETYPANKITYLAPDAEPVDGACDAIDNPDTAPPAGYGAIHILIGFTYMKPPPVGSPPGTLPTPKAFNLIRDHIMFDFVYGSQNGLPAVWPVAVYSKATKVPLSGS